MRTVRDGVFGAIGRRRRTGQCVLGWTRVAPECGAGSALGVPQHSGHGGWGSDASNGGLTARGCLGGGSALLLGVGDRGCTAAPRGPRRESARAAP